MSNTPQPWYEFRHFDTADELLHVISPAPALETGTDNPNFVFRGQPEAVWKLVPSAYRDVGGGRSLATDMVGAPSHHPSHFFQLESEFKLLKEFMSICDEGGIAIPGDSYPLRQIFLEDPDAFTRAMVKDPSRWPYMELISLLAFAQHHGVPTRLLDWTRSGTIAAYFAASYFATPNSKDPNSDGNLAIWALNIEFIKSYDKIELTTMPGSNSARLSAQRGLFIYWRAEADEATDAIDIGRMTLLDKLVESGQTSSMPKPLWKLTLPQEQALRLLYLADLNGVNSASVYPGPAGAGMALRERAAWMRTNDVGENAASEPLRNRPTTKSERTV